MAWMFYNMQSFIPPLYKPGLDTTIFFLSTTEFGSKLSYDMFHICSLIMLIYANQANV